MDPSEAVVKYLRDQNRPYSTNDIFNNLHEEIKKPAIQKALDQLVGRGVITEKVYGKQKVYVVKQEDTGVKDLERELQDLDTKLKDVSQKLAKAEQELKSSENLSHKLLSVPTTSEARSEQTLLLNRVQTLKERLDKISKNAGKMLETDKEQMQKDHENNINEWKKRKRLCMNVVEAILENYPDPKRVLLNEVGIETDEDVQVSLIP
jgi:26S proteasome regulatory subunit (ATPase 3-interacting protein)